MEILNLILYSLTALMLLWLGFEVIFKNSMKAFKAYRLLNTIGHTPLDKNADPLSKESAKNLLRQLAIEFPHYNSMDLCFAIMIFQQVGEMGDSICKEIRLREGYAMSLSLVRMHYLRDIGENLNFGYSEGTLSSDAYEELLSLVGKELVIVTRNSYS